MRLGELLKFCFPTFLEICVGIIEVESVKIFKFVYCLIQKGIFLHPTHLSLGHFNCRCTNAWLLILFFIPLDQHIGIGVELRVDSDEIHFHKVITEIFVGDFLELTVLIY